MLRFIFSFIVFFFYFKNSSFAVEVSCNVNQECPFGFVCISGNAQNININKGITPSNGSYLGACVPTVPMREACYLYDVLTGKLGRAIVVLVLISVGIGWSIGKLDLKQILTVFTGIVLFFGSFQIVKFFMGVKNVGYCALIDYSQPIGFPSQEFIDKRN